MTKTLALALTAALVLVLGAAPAVTAEPRIKFNQTAQYVVEVSTTDWSNYDADGGGCVTCPYTCIKRQTGPTGTSLNLSNATLMASLPAIYSSTVSNGCCYAPKTKSTVMPNCNTEANPATAEACGFLYGPTLKWRIGEALTPPEKPVVRIYCGYSDVAKKSNSEKLTFSCVHNRKRSCSRRSTARTSGLWRRRPSSTRRTPSRSRARSR